MLEEPEVVPATAPPPAAALARDGAVEAVGFGLDGWRFLWTNGAETDGARLRDVPRGTYAATPIAVEGEAPVLVHRCPPARVGVGDAP